MVLVDYPIRISNSTVILDTTKPLYPLNQTETFLSSNLNGSAGWMDEKGLGLVRGFHHLFSSSIVLDPVSFVGRDWFGNDTNSGDNTSESVGALSAYFGWRPLVSGAKFTGDLFALPKNKSCALTFSDPTNRILQSMTEILFRAGFAAAQLPPHEHQLANMTHHQDTIVFKSQYVYYNISAAIIGFACLVVTYTFYDFWLLGRKATLSPIETARAFDPTLFDGSNSNADIYQLLNAIGTKRVRYGYVSSADTLESGDQSWTSTGRTREASLRIGLAEEIVDPHKAPFGLANG